MKPWAQELMWVQRNEHDKIVGIEEKLPKQGDFIPTVHLSKIQDPDTYPRQAFPMGKHDQRRKDALVTALRRSMERATEAHLYLAENDRDPEEIMNVVIVMEHINIALKHLGVEIE